MAPKPATALLALVAACSGPDQRPQESRPADAGRARVGDATADDEAYRSVRALFGARDTGCEPFGCHANGEWTDRSKVWLVLNADGTTEDRFESWAIGRDALVCEEDGREPMKRVEPGSPETSYLVQVLRGTQLCGDLRMPPGGPYLSATQIALVERWIRGLPKRTDD